MDSVEKKLPLRVDSSAMVAFDIFCVHRWVQLNEIDDAKSVREFDWFWQ